MTSFGIKTSLPFKNVFTAIPTEEILNSDFETMAIARQGYAEQTGNSGSTLTFTIRHEMDFVPFILVYYKTSFYPTFWQWAPGIGGASPVTPSGDKNQVQRTDIRIDRENLVIRVALGNGSSDTVTIKYFIFNVPIALSI